MLAEHLLLAVADAPLSAALAVYKPAHSAPTVVLDFLRFDPRPISASVDVSVPRATSHMAFTAAAVLNGLGRIDDA